MCGYNVALMNKIKFRLSLLSSLAILLFSCSKPADIDNTGGNQPKRDTTLPYFTNVFPLNVRIHDTVSLTGQNFDKLKDLLFNDYSSAIIISKTNTKITAVVPVLYNENVVVKAIYAYAPSGIQTPIASDSAKLNLVGIFPLQTPTDLTNIGQIEAVNEKVFYLISYKQLYKTADGGYKWELVKEYNEGISSIFFIDDKNGWVGLYGDNGAKLYYTNDGGKNFEEKFAPTTSYDGNAITGIHFSTPTKGYLLTGKGDIYITSDNTNFNRSYHFPKSNLGSNYPEFRNLSVVNDQLLATGNSGSDGYEPMLIKGNNGDYNYVSFLTGHAGAVQQVDQQTAYMIRNTHYLWGTKDGGTSWNKVSDEKIFNMFFIDKDLGLGISSDSDHSHHTFLLTKDGGESWSKYYELGDFEYTLCAGLSGRVGLIGGYRGRVWKYIKE